jgi:hypothetical protein
MLIVRYCSACPFLQLVYAARFWLKRIVHIHLLAACVDKKENAHIWVRRWSFSSSSTVSREGCHVASAHAYKHSILRCVFIYEE